MELFGSHLQLLERGMDAAMLRQLVAAQNLANVDTAGYKAGRVLFESRLQQALAGGGLSGVRTDPRHLPMGGQSPTDVQPVVETDASRSGRADGNNVDLEVESAGVAANEIWYATMARLASDEFQRLQVAISGGGR